MKRIQLVIETKYKSEDGIYYAVVSTSYLYGDAKGDVVAMFSDRGAASSWLEDNTDDENAYIQLIEIHVATS